MKKIKFVAAAFLMSFALVACNSTDSLIKKYEKACEKGDAVAAAKVAEKLSKVEKELTDEQSERIDNASIKLAGKINN